MFDFNEILKKYPDDFEKYYMFKDNLNIYKYSRGLDIKCLVCDSFNHMTNSCHYINYFHNKDRVFYNIK